MTIHPPHSHSDQHSLMGKRAVVTGSSHGIGRAIALQLAGAGAELVIHGCHHQSEAEEVVNAINQAGGKALLQMLDLTQPENQDQLVEQTWCDGPIDIWINNAGADVLTGQVASETFEARLQRLWQVDVVATMRMSRDVGQRMINQRMINQGQGVILNMGWDQAQLNVAGNGGMAGDSGQMFAAIKGAIMAFSLSLAKSLAPQVRVNCLAPGWIRTRWGETAATEWQQRAKRESLLDRWGSPEDVACTAQFLVSDQASFINGQILSINGGCSGYEKWAGDEGWA